MRYNPMTVFPLFVLLIVIIGIAYASIYNSRFLNESMAQIQPATSPTPSPTVQPTEATAVQPNPSPETNDLNSMNNKTLTDFKYPNSKVISESNNKLVLESTASANAVTNWYKQLLADLNFNTTSAASSQVNNQYEAKLAAAKSAQSIAIEIKKDENNPVIIIIELTAE